MDPASIIKAYKEAAEERRKGLSEMTNAELAEKMYDILEAEIAAFEALGLSKEEMDVENISRSNGLISITEQGMKDSEIWGEGFAILDFDNETFENDIFYEEEPDSEAFEFDEIDYDTLPQWDPPMEFTGAIKWENVEAARDWYWENYGKDRRYILGKLNNGNILVSVT